MVVVLFYYVVSPSYSKYLTTQKTMEIDQSAEISNQESTQINEEGVQGTPMQQGKSKRGRKPKACQVSKEEDVCFLCFDGGQLILCDRRSCPKVYHLQCIERDAEFFQTSESWFCGWHYCARCRKAAVVQCYTCPTAFCRKCIKNTPFLHIRKTRGLCDVCFELMALIEYGETANAEGIKVDFDDRETYEFLYKDYWKDLKNEISLTRQELDRAMKAKEAGKQLAKNNGNYTNRVFKDRDASDKELDDEPKPKQRRRNKSFFEPSILEDASESDYYAEEYEKDEKIVKSRRGNTKASDLGGWASKELLDFIQLMKEDPKKPLSQNTVYELLWTYIDNNKLQDPQSRGQIVCDERLQRLLGRKRVGQFEVRKLLNSQFTSKQGNAKNIHDNGLDNELLEVSSSDDGLVKVATDKRRKSRRLEKSKGMISYFNKYAAVNVWNINLIYLKRTLLEDLLNDPNHENKVVGSIIRIRSLIGKNDTGYRLVQVSGIKRLSDLTNTEQRMISVALEVLNIQKQEQVTTDLISDQDFTEEECQQLRQNIKEGLIKAMTVGELEEKAKALQEVKFKDWLNTELLKLCCLRDRANEKGCRKELREYVQKLQLLRSPEERERRLREPLHVMPDSHMDPTIESDVETPANSSPAPTADTHVDPPINSDAKKPVNSTQGGFRATDDENEKIWHYQDRTRKIQGPFSLKQLRKWEKTNLFPLDLRIWRTTESQDEAILLTDALLRKLDENLLFGFVPQPNTIKR